MTGFARWSFASLAYICQNLAMLFLRVGMNNGRVHVLWSRRVSSVVSTLRHFIRFGGPQGCISERHCMSSVPMEDDPCVGHPIASAIVMGGWQIPSHWYPNSLLPVLQNRGLHYILTALLWTQSRYFNVIHLRFTSYIMSYYLNIQRNIKLITRTLSLT